MKTKARIHVWLDRDSGGDPKWIVAAEDVDERGGVEYTKTLSVHDERAEAVAAGEKQAESRGLPFQADKE